MQQLQIHGVYVGRPQTLRTASGRAVSSAIAKHPVTTKRIDVGLTNLAGDEQADLKAHGGPDKALLAYPREHYRFWQQDGYGLMPGDVGENLNTLGADEHRIRIGSTWAWGEAVVQVTQPRSPCFKLSIHTGRRDIGERMIANGRCGWYLRVLLPGAVDVSGALVWIDEPAGAPTVLETFRAMFEPKSLSLDRVAAVLDSAELAEQWRAILEARLVQRQ